MLQSFPARDGRDSPLKYTLSIRCIIEPRARDGRDSPLKYTAAIWMHVDAHARDGRDSPLKYTHSRGQRHANELGMAGIHRSSTLGRAELAEKQQVGAASLFRKARFGRGFLRVLAVFVSVWSSPVDQRRVYAYGV